ncbi:MAG: nuclear transport factor 2 family protein [Hyphomicrobium sp.]
MSDVQSAASAWDAAFNSGDTAKLADFYAPDARVIPAGGAPVTGAEAAGKFFADLIAKGLPRPQGHHRARRGKGALSPSPAASGSSPAGRGRRGSAVRWQLGGTSWSGRRPGGASCCTPGTDPPVSLPARGLCVTARLRRKGGCVNTNPSLLRRNRARDGPPS